MNASFALLGDLGGLEVLVIALLALIMFGSKRLPEFGRAAGRAIRQFKRATSGVEENLREVMREDPLANALRPASRQIPRGRTLSSPASDPATTTTATSMLPPAAAAAASATTTSHAQADSKPAPEKSPGAEDEIAG